MIKVSDILQEARQELQKSSIISYGIDSLVLLQEICNLTKEQIIFNNNLQITQDLANKYMAAIDLRKKSMPVAKIIGGKDFFDSRFIVNEHVLDPRPDSEAIIEEVLNSFADKLQKINFLEIGVGSGCIVLSLLKIYKNFQAIAVDISKNALEVCRKNADIMDLSNRIKLIKGDLFADIKERFDLIISNPPYIKTADINKLDRDVSYDPLIALDGGYDGLDFYRRIADDAMLYLKEFGKIIIEIGHDQELTVKHIFTEKGFNFINKRNDLNGFTRVLHFAK